MENSAAQKEMQDEKKLLGENQHPKKKKSILMRIYIIKKNMTKLIFIVPTIPFFFFSVVFTRLVWARGRRLTLENDELIKNVW